MFGIRFPVAAARRVRTQAGRPSGSAGAAATPPRTPLHRTEAARRPRERKSEPSPCYDRDQDRFWPLGLTRRRIQADRCQLGAGNAQFQAGRAGMNRHGRSSACRNICPKSRSSHAAQRLTCTRRASSGSAARLPSGMPTREINISERPEVPWLSVVFGYGPMLPLVLGALEAWRSAGPLRGEAILLTVIWAASILAFLAGVRRGLSFRTEGGPASAQLVTMFGLFVLALAALVAIVHGLAVYAVALVLIGFVAVMVLDPVAARRGQAPLFFARLRPPQIAIAVLSLLALLANIWLRS